MPNDGLGHVLGLIGGAVSLVALMLLGLGILLGVIFGAWFF